MPSIMTQPNVQILDSKGEPAVGWKFYTYDAGTNDPRPTYTDFYKTGQNLNPTILDARGMANIWLDGAYKIVLTDENDVVITTQDNVTSYSGIDWSGIDVDIDISDINSINTACVSVFDDYLVRISDRGKTICVDATDGDVNVYLPAVTTLENKWMGRIKKVDLSINKVNVVTNLTETIDNMIGYTLNSYGDLIEVLCDGTQFYITTLYERNKELQFGTDTTINVTQQDQNKCIKADSTSGNCIVNLPSLASVGEGFVVTIIRSGASTTNTVQITPNGTDTVNWPYSPCNLKTANEVITLIARTDTWLVINYYNPNPGILADIKYSYDFNQPGWIRMDSNWNIGKPSSGAHYSGNIYKDLYIFLWDNYGDYICPVTGGRGSSAEADWSVASKTLQLPQIAGRTIVASGSGVGLPVRTTGTIWGSDTVLLNNPNQNASHMHQMYKGYAQGQSGSNSTGGLFANGGSYPVNGTFSGGGETHDNNQPSAAQLMFIKI